MRGNGDRRQIAECHQVWVDFARIADSGRPGTVPTALACTRRSFGYFPPGGVMVGALS